MFDYQQDESESVNQKQKHAAIFEQKDGSTSEVVVRTKEGANS